MTKGLVSIIVPVYNIRLYLSRCLDSLLAQTYTNIEIITVDDGSTDGSGELLDEYSACDSRIKVIHKQNEGVSSARICGIKVSNGEFIGLCDGDDEVEPDMYARLLKNLENNNADISHCGYKVVYQNGRIKWFYHTGIVKVYDKTNGIESLLTGNFEPSLCSKLYRRVLFNDLINTICFDTSIRIYEDLLMNYYLFKESNKSVYEDFCLYIYHKRENSASTSHINIHHVKDPITVKQLIWEDCKGTEMEEIAESVLLRTCLQTYNNLLMTGKDEFIEEKIEIRQTILQYKKSARCLGYKQRMFTQMILNTPYLYKWIYKVYRIVKK